MSCPVLFIYLSEEREETCPILYVYLSEEGEETCPVLDWTLSIVSFEEYLAQFPRRGSSNKHAS